MVDLSSFNLLSLVFSIYLILSIFNSKYLNFDKKIYSTFTFAVKDKNRTREEPKMFCCEVKKESSIICGKFDFIMTFITSFIDSDAASLR